MSDFHAHLGDLSHPISIILCKFAMLQIYRMKPTAFDNE